VTELTTLQVRGAVVSLLVGGFLCALCAASAHAGLPDGRAYEQVSPVEKNGSDIGTTAGTPVTGVAVSADGNGAAYFSGTPFDGTPSGIVTNYYRATRAASGWSTSSFAYPLPTAPGALDIEYAHRANADLSRLVVSSPFAYDPADTDGPDVSHFPADGWFDQYLYGVPGPAPTWISHGTQGGDAHTESIFAGASDDLTRTVFASKEKLLAGLPDLTGNGFYVYERDTASGETQLINVADGGNVVEDGATVGNGNSSGFEPAFDSGTARNAVSDDGTKIFFESPIPGSGTPTKLYMRDTAAGTTTLVSPNATSDAIYAGASSDGSKVFFISSEALTGDDTDTDPDLYMYDVGAATVTRVSHGASGTDDANVAGVAAISDNGAHVYFVAMHALSSDNFGGADGEPNVYRYDTATNNTSFVATLSSGSLNDNNVYSGNDVAHSAFTTPNGRTLAFVSDTNQTSYDSEGHTEVYVYKMFPQGLACASCRTDGTGPQGDANLGFRNDAGFEYGWTNPISDDGTRVFFNTTDTLVGDDANGNAPNGGSQDVYEYNGVPNLISSGHSTWPSWLASVSKSGDDAFFFTRDALVQSDVDGGELDLYDARVNGGFASAPQVVPCEGDACRGTPAAAPFLPTPATTTATGSNVTPEPFKPKPTFSVTGVTKAAARRAARTGRLVVFVHVTAAGKIRASAFAKSRRVATAAHTFGAAGAKHLTLKLSKAARVQLRRTGRLSLRIDVTYSRGGKRTAHVTLRRSSR
jgi:hypothetical protein